MLSKCRNRPDLLLMTRGGMIIAFVYTYRKYYISGAQMVGGLIKTIPQQYEDAIANGPIRTVILDGGGNDIEQGEPCP